jgi:uncharacterized protein YkwD
VISNIRKSTKIVLLILLLYGLLGLLTFADDWHIEIYSGELLLDPVDAEPYLNEDGRTMVPVRFIAESFGADVTWKSDTQSVILELKDTVVEFRVDDATVIINGIPSEMDTKMVLDPVMGRTFVPFRFAVEPLGVVISDVNFTENQILRIDLLKEASINNLSLGNTSEVVIATLGQPTAKGLSAYGFEWWFYADDYKQYLQIGIADDQVVVLYTNSSQWSYENTYSGMSLEALKAQVDIESVVETTYKNTNLKIKQVDNKERFLNVHSDVAIEWFYDEHDMTVSSIRISKMPYILTQSSYAYNYSYFKDEAPNFKPPILTQNEQIRVDQTNSLMLFHLTNASRVNHKLPPLSYHLRVSELALSHSLDMYTNNYFDHTSPSTGTLGDRFKAWNIPFRSIMENIAWGQADGIYAHEGLMNSLGHRLNILSDRPTHLGTGSYGKYYTVNFLQTLD